MCCDRRIVFAVFRQHWYLVIPLATFVCSLLVTIEMVEKLSIYSKTYWSPLRVLGPATWLPLTTDTRSLMAAQTLIHSIMYCMACYYLAKGIIQRADALLAPWYAMHSFFLSYQLTLLVVFREDYQSSDNVMAVGSSLVNFALVLFAMVIMLTWCVQDLLDE